MLCVGLTLGAPISVHASQQTVIAGLSPARLFDLASRAEGNGDAEAAKEIYRALQRDAALAVRNEARFRHAKLLIRAKRLTEAAVLYRAILDEQPEAQPVRLELASLLAQMGDLAGARQALRHAQAGGLPPDVARVVDQYAAALRSFKRFSASLEVALAPTSNINRATTAATLDTVLAPLQLSDDARAKSGVGVRIGGQASGRLPVRSNFKVIARAAVQSSFYRDSSFNDASASAQVGVETNIGTTRLRPLVGRSVRRYGGELYATTNSVVLSVTRSTGTRSQVEANLGLGSSDYHLNDLQDGRSYNFSITLERAFSARFGGSTRILFDRQNARDRGYATTSGGLEVLAWRDAGPTTLYATVSALRLISDQRLILFPERRKDWQYRAMLGATFRQFTVAGFAPLLRLTVERNRSTVGIYDYRRSAADIGVTRAF